MVRTAGKRGPERAPPSVGPERAQGKSAEDEQEGYEHANATRQQRQRRERNQQADDQLGFVVEFHSVPS